MGTQPTFNFDSDRSGQAAKILAYLKAGNRITPLESLELFGCFRLGARIYDLKRAGHKIESEMIKVQSGKRVASYRLVVQ
jgi:helix-turn-helix protein